MFGAPSRRWIRTADRQSGHAGTIGGNSVQVSRIMLTLVGLFAATALVLACIGIYG